MNEALCAAIPGSVGLVGVLQAMRVPELGLVGEPLAVLGFKELLLNNAVGV